MTKQERYQPVRTITSALSMHFYATMGGFVFYGSDDDNISNAKESPFEILTDPGQLVEAPKNVLTTYIAQHFRHIIVSSSDLFLITFYTTFSLCGSPSWFFCIHQVLPSQPTFVFSLAGPQFASHTRPCNLHRHKLYVDTYGDRRSCTMFSI